MKITKSEVLKELERELEKRKQVYPRWIKSGKLHRDLANKRFLALKEAIRLLKDEPEKPQYVQQKMFQ